MDPVLALGQLLGGGGFIGLGITLLLRSEDMMAWLGSKELPGGIWHMRAGAFLIIVGGLMLIADFEVSIAILMLVVFIVSTMMIDIINWQPKSDVDRAERRLHFWKNIMVSGMLLMLYSLSSQNGLYAFF